MRRRVLKAVLGLGVLALSLSLGIGLSVRNHDRALDGQPSNILSLSPPAFAQSVSTSEFPHNEAGICAYVDMGGPISLSQAETVFSGIEASETDYVVGTVALPNLAEDMWPHVYISSTGWIMAYFPKTEPTSRIVQWIGYQRDKITTTTLRDTLVTTIQKLGLSTATLSSSMSYYHFQFPGATKLLIAVDTTEGTDTFTYTIPLGLSLYEASWSHYASGAHSYDGSHTDIDSVRMYSGGGGTYVGCGDLETQFRTPDSAHEVKVYCTRNWAGAAVVFLHD